MADDNLPALSPGRAVVPATGTAVVVATGTAVVSAAGAAVIQAEEPAAAEKPREIPKARKRDPKRMTAAEARRLVNRVRRVRFYLWMRTPCFDSPYEEDYSGTSSNELLTATAAQLMAILKEIERRHPTKYVRVSYSEEHRYLALG